MSTFATALKKTTHVYKQSDIWTIELRKNCLEKLMNEGQGHKLSNFKMKKKGIFH